jgi:hypothetical protein
VRLSGLPKAGITPRTSFRSQVWSTYWSGRTGRAAASGMTPIPARRRNAVSSASPGSQGHRVPQSRSQGRLAAQPRCPRGSERHTRSGCCGTGSDRALPLWQHLRESLGRGASKGGVATRIGGAPRAWSTGPDGRAGRERTRAAPAALDGPDECILVRMEPRRGSWWPAEQPHRACLPSRGEETEHLS